MYVDDLADEFTVNGKQIKVLFGDITRLTADVIVSSDDNHISMGGGVSQAISDAAGETVWHESRKYVPATLGSVVVTSAGSLDARFVFHAIVIDFENNKWPDVEILRQATSNCLLEADRRACSTIALPALGTGAGGLSSEAAASSVIGAIFDHLEKATHIQTVTLVLNRRDTLIDFVKLSIETKVKAEYDQKLEVLRTEKDKIIAELKVKSPYQKLPYPIAVVRRLADSHENYHSKFTSIIECAESIIKFCACVALAEYVRLQPDSVTELRSYFKQPASLGSWQSQLENGLDFLKNQASFSAIPKIRACLENQEGM